MAERPAPAVPTRQRLLDAAEHLMRTIGLARVTTREIARAAGCSEAALYKHFSGKEELFVTVLGERLPPLGALLAELTDDPGGRTVEECLTDIACRAALFYDSSVPIASSLLAETALLERHREGLRALGTGPHTPLRALAEYLRAERDHGRIRADADPEAAASLLLGACYQRAFLRHFMGEAEPRRDSVEEFAAAIARVVADGIR
ncbi:TetR/AcrR family transcriptional regulator [Streptomyces capparidis]